MTRKPGRLVAFLTLIALFSCSTPATPGVTSVTIDGGDRNVELGESLTLTATVEATGGGTEVTWTSSDESVATVDELGVVATLAVGTARITATSSEDAVKSDTITVTVGPSDAVSVAIVGGDRTLGEGTRVTLQVDVETGGVIDDGVTWSSSDTSVAVIDTDGVLDAITTGTTTITAESIADPSKDDSIVVTVYEPGSHIWTRQFGTVGDDRATGVAADGNGNIYVAGGTSGDLGVVSSAGSDAFVRAYDESGGYRWTWQSGRRGDDEATGIATDAAGNVYVVGTRPGRLGTSETPNKDGFIQSLDSEGSSRWFRGFGVVAVDDYVNDVVADAAGNIYVVGHTDGNLEGSSSGDTDAFVRAFDSEGSLRWTRQFGTDGVDYANGIATDGEGNVYIAGSTIGSLGAPSAGFWDAFVRSYDGNGALRWTRQFGTSEADQAFGIGADEDGNVYVVGRTWGPLEGNGVGFVDGFVRAYDGRGDHRWTRQFGAAEVSVYDSSIDTNGNVYVAGFANGSFAPTYVGHFDAIVRSYDSNGDHRWSRQFGSYDRDEAYGISVESGTVYVAGWTHGDLEGECCGSWRPSDAFVGALRP
jgi:hypothetical protein